MIPIYIEDAKSTDVIGNRIIGIDQYAYTSESEVHFAWNFYRLSSGLILSIGFKDDSEDSTLLKAKPMDAELFVDFIDSKIESIWQLHDDSSFEEVSPFAFRMDNGFYVGEQVSARHGTGWPGVFATKEKERIPFELKRYW